MTAKGNLNDYGYNETDGEYIANTYARFPVCLTGGKGAVLLRRRRKEYIDLGSGIAVNQLRRRDDIWR